MICSGFGLYLDMDFVLCTLILVWIFSLFCVWLPCAPRLAFVGVLIVVFYFYFYSYSYFPFHAMVFNHLSRDTYTPAFLPLSKVNRFDHWTRRRCMQAVVGRWEMKRGAERRGRVERGRLIISLACALHSILLHHPHSTSSYLTTHTSPPTQRT